MSKLVEKDGDLINHWYILALESEVPSETPIKRWLYDLPYVLFRDASGKVAVLRDQCLHRGAQLSEGKLVQGSIACPYHGWRYDPSGKVVEIPSDGPDAGSKDKFCLRKIPMVISDGCVWIWPGDLSLATAGPTWKFPNHGSKSIAQYFMITEFDNEVTHLVQNFMDVPHTVFVHSKWFRNRALLKVAVDVAANDSRLKVTYKQPDDSIGFTERVLNPSRAPMIHTDEFIFPNITRVDYAFGEKFFIINSQCSPISEYKSRVYTWIAYYVGPLTHLLKPFMKYYTRQVIEQDVVIMRNQGENFKTFGEGEFNSTQADELYFAIDKMRELGIKSRFEPASVNFTREREFWI